MRLQHITFTGVDANTNIERLIEIQRKYPIAEFGVLTSYHWYENGNRYLDPRKFHDLTRLKLNLALHICGSAASDAARGEWDKIYYLTWGQCSYFNRIQLNVAGHRDFTTIASESPWWNEIILQQKAENGLTLYEKIQNEWNSIAAAQLSVLLDSSGGRGLDTGLKVLPSLRKVGYAGGINPDNVEEKLSFLMSRVTMGEFWIDMETGVRTNDWFDLDKVNRVLEICQPIIEGHQGQSQKGTKPTGLRNRRLKTAG